MIKKYVYLLLVLSLFPKLVFAHSFEIFSPQEYYYINFISYIIFGGISLSLFIGYTIMVINTKNYNNIFNKNEKYNPKKLSTIIKLFYINLITIIPFVIAIISWLNNLDYNSKKALIDLHIVLFIIGINIVIVDLIYKTLIMLKKLNLNKFLSTSLIITYISYIVILIYINAEHIVIKPIISLIFFIFGIFWILTNKLFYKFLKKNSLIE